MSEIPEREKEVRDIEIEIKIDSWGNKKIKRPFSLTRVETTQQ